MGYSGMRSKIKVDKFLLISILLALVVRLGLVWCQPNIGPYYGMMSEMGEAARNLVEGRGYVINEEYWHTVLTKMRNEGKPFDIEDVTPPKDERFKPYYALPPGTSILLAGTYWIFGEYRYIYLRVIEAIIDAFGCFFMFLIGRELFSRRIGLISAFLYAAWLPIAYLATWPLHDALMPFITLTSLYFFVMGVRRRAIRFYVLSGLFMGIGCYFQPTILFLPFFFGLGLFMYNVHKSNFKEQIASVVKATMIMMTVLALVITPWIVRNYSVTGAFIGMRPGPWSGLWEGFGEFGENPVGAQCDDDKTYELAKKELGYDIEDLSPDYQAFFRAKVFNALKEHPAWYLGLVARRVPLAIFYTSELGINHILRDPDFQNPTIAQVAGMIRNDTFWEFVMDHPFTTCYRIMVYAFAIVPVLLSFAAFWVTRRNWRPMVLVATTPVYFSAIHIATMVASYKSMVPGSLGYIIFSAITLNYIYIRIKGSSAEGNEPDISLG